MRGKWVSAMYRIDIDLGRRLRSIVKAKMVRM